MTTRRGYTPPTGGQPPTMIKFTAGFLSATAIAWWVTASGRRMQTWK